MPLNGDTTDKHKRYGNFCVTNRPSLKRETNRQSLKRVNRMIHSMGTFAVWELKHINYSKLNSIGTFVVCSD